MRALPTPASRTRTRRRRRPVYSAALTCGGPVFCYEASNVPGYALLDLQGRLLQGPVAGAILGPQRHQHWYWSAADRVNDTILRYTGMPTTYGVTFTYRYR